MRYPSSEKLEIIRLVEHSHLPAKRTLDKLGIPRTTFYRWYDKYLDGGVAALEDKAPKPSRVWNRIPDDMRRRIVDLALESRTCHPGNWRYALPIRSAILYQKLPSIACLRPMT